MTARDFMRTPTPEEWQAAIEAGWTGPDGSSSSTDRIFGVRIGSTSTDPADWVLPANAHDWRYHRLRFLWTEGVVPLERLRAFQYRADVAYRRGCIARVKAARGRLWSWLAVARAWVRYRALRKAGHLAWQRRPDER